MFFTKTDPLDLISKNSLGFDWIFLRITVNITDLPWTKIISDTLNDLHKKALLKGIPHARLAEAFDFKAPIILQQLLKNARSQHQFMNMSRLRTFLSRQAQNGDPFLKPPKKGKKARAHFVADRIRDLLAIRMGKDYPEYNLADYFDIPKPITGEQMARQGAVFYLSQRPENHPPTQGSILAHISTTELFNALFRDDVFGVLLQRFPNIDALLKVAYAQTSDTDPNEYLHQVHKLALDKLTSEERSLFLHQSVQDLNDLDLLVFVLCVTMTKASMSLYPENMPQLIQTTIRYTNKLRQALHKDPLSHFQVQSLMAMESFDFYDSIPIESKPPETNWRIEALEDGLVLRSLKDLKTSWGDLLLAQITQSQKPSGEILIEAAAKRQNTSVKNLIDHYKSHLNSADPIDQAAYCLALLDPDSPDWDSQQWSHAMPGLHFKYLCQLKKDTDPEPINIVPLPFSQERPEEFLPIAVGQSSPILRFENQDPSPNRGVITFPVTPYPSKRQSKRPVFASPKPLYTPSTLPSPKSWKPVTPMKNTNFSNIGVIGLALSSHIKFN